MKSIIRIVTPAVLMLAVGLWAMPTATTAAELPKATKKMLKKLKLETSILKGLDKELAVPQAWVDGAKKEGELNIYATSRMKQWKKISAPFKERYPYIKVNYKRVSNSTRRTIKPLMAFKQGRYLTDIVTGLGGSYFLFKEAKAFASLRNLPSYKNVPLKLLQSDGRALSTRLRHWCISYNTNLVKKSELPKTWDDLATNPRWKGKKIGLSTRPNLWVLNLWVTKGEAWTKKFMDDLFQQRPQLRKEGLSAMIALVGAGEFEIAAPSAMNRVIRLVRKGAPVGFHCPDPIPFSVSEVGIMKGNPHINASRIFVNWLLSKEGQIAQFYGDASTPIHIGLRRPEFLAFPDAVKGKSYAEGGPGLEKEAKLVLRYWENLWRQAGGPKKKKRGKKKKK